MYFYPVEVKKKKGDGDQNTVESRKFEVRGTRDFV